MLVPLQKDEPCGCMECEVGGDSGIMHSKSQLWSKSAACSRSMAWPAHEIVMLKIVMRASPSFFFD